jgi:hypothetical protein
VLFGTELFGTHQYFHTLCDAHAVNEDTDTDDDMPSLVDADTDDDDENG